MNKKTLHIKKPVVRPKLVVNKPGDQYEQEADAMAESVMRTSASRPPVSGGVIADSIRRKCAECEKEEEEKEGKLMRKAEGSGGFEASHELSSQLDRSRGGGAPLPDGTRNFMEHAFSKDFSGVRVHTDGGAAEMNKGIRAKAFTYGRDIYFNTGQFAPGSAEGRRLLAHELTHIVQQDGHSRSPLQRKAAQEGVVFSFHIGKDTIYNATAEQAVEKLKPLQRQLFISIDADRYRHIDQNKINQDQAAVAFVSNLFGPNLPPLEIWDKALDLSHSAARHLQQKEITEAIDDLHVAGDEWKKAHIQLYDYLEKTISHAEIAAAGLGFIKTASELTVGLIATALTGGAAAGLISAGYGALTSVAEQGSEVQYGLKDSIDFTGIAFDTVFGLITGHYLGKLGNGIAGSLIKKIPSLATLGKKLVVRVVGDYLLGSATSILHAASRNIFDHVRGSKEAVTVEELIDRIERQLTDPQSIFFTIVGGELTRRIAAKKAAESSKIGGGDKPPGPPRQDKVPTPPPAVREPATIISEPGAPTQEPAPAVGEPPATTQTQAPQISKPEPVNIEDAPINQKKSPVAEGQVPEKQVEAPAEERTVGAEKVNPSVPERESKAAKKERKKQEDRNLREGEEQYENEEKGDSKRKENRKEQRAEKENSQRKNFKADALSNAENIFSDIESQRDKFGTLSFKNKVRLFRRYIVRLKNAGLPDIKINSLQGRLAELIFGPARAREFNLEQLSYLAGGRRISGQTFSGTARPDYPRIKYIGDKIVRLHTNLKSSRRLYHLDPVEGVKVAREIAQEDLRQAVRNAKALPATTPDSPHEKIAIEYVFTPPENIREIMKTILLGDGKGPVAEVKFGTIVYP